MTLLLNVSVAGCLGYDVLASENSVLSLWRVVSVAGCLGYDVLVYWPAFAHLGERFSCWLFRL